MDHNPETRLSLLHRVRDAGDDGAWVEFVQLYEPLVYRVARRRGLQDADAREVTQDVLLTVANAIESWRPGERQGAFRAWLSRITRNLTVNLLVKQQRQIQGIGGQDVARLLDELPEPSESDSSLFDEEYQRQLFRRAAEKVRPLVHAKTWDAFWRTAVEGQPVRLVARDLKMQVGSVYAARSRVTARLNEQVRILANEFDQENADDD